MNLELITVAHAGRSKYASPFDEHDGYADRWWNRPIGDDPDSRFIQVLSDGVEVARVELDEKVSIAHDEGTPDLGDVALEIQFIEVSNKYRQQGIGSGDCSPPGRASSRPPPGRLQRNRDPLFTSKSAAC